MSRIRLLLRGLTVTACLSVAAAAGQHQRPFEYRQVHMGLPVRILLHASSEHRAETAARAAFERIAALDRMMSDYRPDSELRRLERSTEWTGVSPELLDVLFTSVTMARATGGAFDPTVAPLVALWREARATRTLPEPRALAKARSLVGWRHLEVDHARAMVRLAKPGMRMDLGGVAKGYILQQALRVLAVGGIHSALIESGGDIVVGSAPPDAAGWRIDAPAGDDVFRRRAGELTNAALATSGSTEQFVELDGVRYSHVIDPRTGTAVTRRVVARVIAADAATADALATALTVLGPDGVKVMRERFPSVLITLSTTEYPAGNIALLGGGTP